MKKQKETKDKNAGSPGPVSDPETERLRRDIFRTDMEKFQLFIHMLRRNALFKKAVVTHK